MLNAQHPFQLLESATPKTFFDVLDLLWWYRENPDIQKLLTQYDYQNQLTDQVHNDNFLLLQDLANTINNFLVEHSDTLLSQQLQFLLSVYKRLQTSQVKIVGKPKETTHDFLDRQGPVPVHQHKNPDGSVGGWAAETAAVEKLLT